VACGGGDNEHFRELMDWVEGQRPEPTVATGYAYVRGSYRPGDVSRHLCGLIYVCDNFLGLTYVLVLFFKKKICSTKALKVTPGMLNYLCILE
jgi:hypothetical protein